MSVYPIFVTAILCPASFLPHLKLTLTWFRLQLALMDVPFTEMVSPQFLVHLQFLFAKALELQRLEVHWTETEHFKLVRSKLSAPHVHVSVF